MASSRRQHPCMAGRCFRLQAAVDVDCCGLECGESTVMHHSSIKASRLKMRCSCLQRCIVLAFRGCLHYLKCSLVCEPNSWECDGCVDEGSGSRNHPGPPSRSEHASLLRPPISIRSITSNASSSAHSPMTQ